MEDARQISMLTSLAYLDIASQKDTLKRPMITRSRAGKQTRLHGAPSRESPRARL
jgi:hypothetical protein